MAGLFADKTSRVIKFNFLSSKFGLPFLFAIL